MIIAHQDAMNKAQVLRTFRQAQGLSTAVVDIEDVYDEFSFGQKTPYAVKDFLNFARKSWRVPVRYALMFGDASYDAKNYLGLGEFDQVPTRLIDTTFLEAASDDWLADFDGDGVADLAIGRLPVRNDAEAGLMINKLIAYDKSSPATEVLGVADRNEGYDFEHAIDQLRDLVPADLRTVQVKRGQMGDAAAKAALLESINRGQKVVSYSGHGSGNTWRGNLLTSADALLLQNKSNLPVFLIMNCLNGYFTDPSMDSLSESLLKAPQGGAVAVWASSAMTFPDSQSAMSQEMYRQVFGNRGTRIGDAILRAKAAAFDMDVRQTWILFADPTMQLR